MAPPSSPKITVITLTKHRTRELLECVASVFAQNYRGVIEHIILGDASPTLPLTEPDIKKINPKAVVLNYFLHGDHPSLIPFYSASRTGALRNMGVGMASGELISQLDDDNLIDPDHISSLVDTIQSEPGIGISYSWRKIVNTDGSPYLLEEYPWTPHARLALDPKELSRHIYKELVRAGIRTPGSNIVQDTLLTPSGEPVYTIDTSELMVRRLVHQTFPFTERFTWREMVGDFSDDYSFVKRCHEGGIRFKATKQATLTYRIGGVSTSGGTPPHGVI